MGFGDFASDFGGGLVKAAGDVVGTVLQGYYNRKAAQKANKYNYTAWQLQNEYNTPKEQRQRLEEAGYNPNLWYTNGNTGNAGTLITSGYQAPDYQGLAGRMMSGLAQYQQMEATKANIDNTRANTESIQVATDRTDLESLRLAHDIQYAQEHNLPVGVVSTLRTTVGEGAHGLKKLGGEVARGVVNTLEKTPEQIAKNREYGIEERKRKRLEKARQRGELLERRLNEYFSR